MVLKKLELLMLWMMLTQNGNLVIEHFKVFSNIYAFINLNTIGTLLPLVLC